MTSPHRTLRIWILAILGTATAAAALRVHEISARLGRLESAPRADPDEVAALRRELARAETRIAASIEEIARLRGEGERTAEMDRRIGAISGELDRAAATLAEQRSRLERFEADAPRAFDERLESFRKGAEEQWRGLDETARSALEIARTASRGVEQVEQELTRDEERMWRELVAPTVQILGDETVGSGVLLQSQPIPNTDAFRTFALTAWHVVRDLQASPDDVHFAVPITIYDQEKHASSETARVVKSDPGIDLALLLLETARPLDRGARLAPRSRLEKVRIFDPVYAVGCPLGNEPIPTYGEIADTHHVVDGLTYWMISAPTFIGNSGGGIFDARSHELLGIFSKIYTHGAVRPTVVPHMGLATSMRTVYDWLDSVGYASVEASAATGAAQVASAKR